jgi:hypothetical protein
MRSKLTGTLMLPIYTLLVRFFSIYFILYSPNTARSEMRREPGSIRSQSQVQPKTEGNKQMEEARPGNTAPFASRSKARQSYSL